jgi:hypothetical protein
MPRVAKMNEFRIEEVEGVECVIFKTNGKTELEVIVDRLTWFGYLNKYSWTVNGNKNNTGRGSLEVKASINGVSKSIYRFIAETEFGELFTYGREIDHINLNPLDNRVCNLRPVSPRFNSNNKNRKNIYVQNNGTRFKASMNIDGVNHYKLFMTIEEAENYRDNVLIPLKEKEIIKLQKRDRDIEFERGLMSKIEHGELDEILEILNKHNIPIGGNYETNFQRMDGEESTKMQVL